MVYYIFLKVAILFIIICCKLYLKELQRKNERGYNVYAVTIECLRLYHATMILHCHWRQFQSRNTDVSSILSIISSKNEKLFFEATLEYLFFRLVAHLLNMICLKPRILNQILYIYIGFGMIFTQFYINFSRQEHQIEIFCGFINS